MMKKEKKDETETKGHKRKRDTLEGEIVETKRGEVRPISDAARQGRLSLRRWSQGFDVAR